MCAQHQSDSVSDRPGADGETPAEVFRCQSQRFANPRPRTESEFQEHWHWPCEFVPLVDRQHFSIFGVRYFFDRFHGARRDSGLIPPTEDITRNRPAMADEDMTQNLIDFLRSLIGIVERVYNSQSYKCRSAATLQVFQA
jgi:hypothetical protein